MSHRVLFVLGLFVAICFATPSSAQTTPYQLNPTGTDYTYGCYPPCLCPIFVGEFMTGGFELTFTSFDGLYNNYDITGIDWATTGSQLVGSGTYRVSVGAPEVMHEITLDLAINGEPHLLVSGLLPTDDIFPTIQIGAAENGYFCFDYTVLIDATPVFAPAPDFVRGDCNVDNSTNIADAIFALDTLFIPGSTGGPCAKACDANDDGSFNLADVITLLSHLFLSGPIPPPFPGCGADPTMDSLSCDAFGFCP
ncbi:MAG: hypothetical protein ACKVX7_15780 [Planctomycetota bacterium]